MAFLKCPQHYMATLTWPISAFCSVLLTVSIEIFFLPTLIYPYPVPNVTYVTLSLLSCTRDCSRHMMVQSFCPWHACPCSPCPPLPLPLPLSPGPACMSTPPDKGSVFCVWMCVISQTLLHIARKITRSSQGPFHTVGNVSQSREEVEGVWYEVNGWRQGADVNYRWRRRGVIAKLCLCNRY